MCLYLVCLHVCMYVCTRYTQFFSFRGMYVLVLTCVCVHLPIHCYRLDNFMYICTSRNEPCASLEHLPPIRIRACTVRLYVLKHMLLVLWNVCCFSFFVFGERFKIFTWIKCGCTHKKAEKKKRMFSHKIFFYFYFWMPAARQKKRGIK